MNRADRRGEMQSSGMEHLDVNTLNKAGQLRPGNSGGWQWTREGKQVASISTRATSQHLILSYRLRPDETDWQDITQQIPIAWVSCPYGGQRPYFLCPSFINGRYCGRRVRKLYLGRGYFLCRHCQNAAYASQSETRLDRARRRADKRRMALGSDPGHESFVRKPKGMHHSTFERHLDFIRAADYCFDLEFIETVRRRFAWIDPHNPL
ncbi:hypothetical protein [Pseudorhodobacter sp.]|uniref:hypothetical protein n=1 Tax=Pseudorhodobacter sp. TaxID=1934400 RepID=UPI002647DF46|nr:hypothetical protein [Pseudorhodobacter sp.]MDN5789018.1 hypothetical protein [Pseudorhodobacter sp.]